MNKRISTPSFSDLIDPVLFRPLTDAVIGLKADGTDSCRHRLSSLAFKTTVQATGKSQCPLCRAPIKKTKPDTPTQKLAEEAIPRFVEQGIMTLIHEIPKTFRSDHETITLHQRTMALLNANSYDKALPQLNELIALFPEVCSLRLERIDCFLHDYENTPLTNRQTTRNKKQFHHFINDLKLLLLDETDGNRTNILALQDLFL